MSNAEVTKFESVDDLEMDYIFERAFSMEKIIAPNSAWAKFILDSSVYAIAEYGAWGTAAAILSKTKFDEFDNSELFRNCFEACFRFIDRHTQWQVSESKGIMDACAKRVKEAESDRQAFLKTTDANDIQIKKAHWSTRYNGDQYSIETAIRATYGSCELIASWRSFSDARYRMEWRAGCAEITWTPLGRVSIIGGSYNQYQKLKTMLEAV